MSTSNQKLVEHIFFFVILGLSAYLVWNLVAPFVGTLFLAAIVVVVCYPYHENILTHIPKQSPTLAALVSLLCVVLAIVVPLSLLSSLILKEALSVYTLFSSAEHISFIEGASKIELFIQKFIPSFSLDIAGMAQQSASFVVSNFVALFTSTASTIFLFFIALIAMFYFFRDGKYFTTYLMQLSPLRDSYNERIMTRLARAVRAVAVGTVFVAIVQGVLTSIGFSIFGFDRAILLGCIAAIGALVPGLGTGLVFIPAVIYLLFAGSQVSALLLALWGVIAVGLVDNFLGPYVMSRGNKVHPFMILLSVLGGIALFGPIGFILGPVTLSFFLVLLEIYSSHMKENEVSE